MNEIKCPHCNKTFKVDEAGYASILKQVRDAEFDKDLAERIHLFEKEKTEAVRLAEANTKNLLQNELSSKELELAQLKADLDNSMSKLTEREKTLQNEKESAVQLIEQKAKNELQKELSEKEKEISQLKADRDSAKNKLAEREKVLQNEKENAVQLIEQKTKNELQKELSKKEAELKELEAQIKQAGLDKDLAITKAVSVVEKDRDELRINLANKENEKQLIKESYETKIKDRDDAIERLKDMKAKLSVKLVGENLEQHCQNEFNGVRASLFPLAYFEKDNEAVKDIDENKGTKGDFIYRDYDMKDGPEIISIMFEMKDEQDVSANKKTVESHLDKLDKDRKKKGLEYAVLVTLLESENELYNRGIVDLSYKYEKMYVVRPQFFLPLISLLKNASVKAAEAKRQLMIIQSQNIDITTFEEDVNNWKTGWLTSMKNAGKKHVEAVEQINKAIKDLEKVRDALTLSDKHLLSAENKMDDLTVKRLTRKNPTMAAKFEELKNDR